MNTGDTNGAGGLPTLYLLVHHAEPGDLPDFTWCDGRGSLYDAVSAAVFVDGPEDDDQREEVRGITDELIRTGWFRFEGDPPLQLLTAPGELCRATREGDGGLADTIVRDACETDPADPDAPDTICIPANLLHQIVLRTLSRVAVQEGG